jgi:hypothetical protein
MDRLVFKLLVSLLLSIATQAHADKSFMVSPSIGNASTSNIKGYDNVSMTRVDGSYFPVPELGVNLFVEKYSDFKPSGNGPAVAINVKGYGTGIIGRWPVHPNVQPYVRLDYMRWTVEAVGLGRVLGRDIGHSPGLALGVHFPITEKYGVKAEASGFNKVNSANIRKLMLGLTIAF